jgi:hypothetical protein
MGGTVALYPVLAATDAPAPYLVYRLETSPGGFYPMTRGSLYIDIWADNPDSNTVILPARKRIIELLEQREFSTTEISWGITELQTCGFVPELDTTVGGVTLSSGTWHYAMQFNLMYYHSNEVDSVAGRG